MTVQETSAETQQTSPAADPCYEQILYEERGTVALVHLHRPDKLNAWTREMNNELLDAFGRANENPQIGAIVVTGSGRGFCAGADVKAAFAKRMEGEDQAASVDERRENWVDCVRDSKPVIGAINGVAVGVGITLALPFDVLIASESAKVGMFFVKMGVVPELASSHLLVQRVGWGHANEMCLTGRLYRAAELERIGLVNRVVADDELLDEALALGETIAANPESSLRWVKELITQNGSCDDLSAVQERELAALQEAYESPAHKEAVKAFLEGRPPKFR